MQNNEPSIPVQNTDGQQGFYRAFEDKFRGSRELILSRLKVYLPFILPLKQISSELPAVDLGCGRGEWLELLKENGFQGQGVDLDADMLSSCQERGLQTVQGDAVDFLGGLPSESQLIISGFHIAEHLPFEKLQKLVMEALRVLKPAGLLILETPNPENLKVSSVGFYMDPSHRHPLPPELLAFVPDYVGFARVKIVRLQENPELLNAKTVSLDQVLGGASPDYAVVAQKHADVAVLDSFSDAFEKDYGLPVSTLLQRYESGEIELGGKIREAMEGQKRIDSMQTVIDRLEEARVLHEAQWQQRAEDDVRLGELVQRVSSLEAQKQHVEGLVSRLEGVHAAMERAHERLAFADKVHAAFLESLHRERVADAKLQQVLQSRSWRMTRGFRLVARTLRAGVSVAASARVRLRIVLIRLARAATARPLIRRTGAFLLRATPRLKARLVRGVVNDAPPAASPSAQPPISMDGGNRLTARARIVRSMLDGLTKSP